MNLFVTVGTQFPFDRLVRTVDQWVALRPDVRVFAQVGPTMYAPRHIRYEPFIDAGECRQRVEEADAVIAHAGMGSILTALELGKPIIVMPRRAELDEHRNDHQMATARSLLSMGMVIVAFDESHLREKLDHLDQFIGNRRGMHAQASPRLLTTLREFVKSGTYHAPERTPNRVVEVYPAPVAEIPQMYMPPPPSEMEVFANQPTHR